MKPVRQLSQEDAQALFDYRNGRLYWRHVSSGHRRDRCAIRIKNRREPKRGRTPELYSVITVGDLEYQAHYIVWNWHMGVTDKAVVFKDGDKTNCDFRNLAEAPRGIQKIIGVKSGATDWTPGEEFIAGQSGAIQVSAHDNFIEGQSGAVNANCCPTCAQTVTAPTYDFIVRHLNLQPLHARILKAVWDGKGHPVMPGRIFDYMYEDDIDGGPSDAMMYSNFKVALCRLRARLEGSGVGIENAGYRAGYRLVLKGK